MPFARAAFLQQVTAHKTWSGRETRNRCLEQEVRAVMRACINERTATSQLCSYSYMNAWACTPKIRESEVGHLTPSQLSFQPCKPDIKDMKVLPSSVLQCVGH